MSNCKIPDLDPSDIRRGIRAPIVQVTTMVPLIGLMITKEDHEVFGDWCSDQLALYDAVVCLDGSSSGVTRRIAAEYPGKIHYVHENQLQIGHKTDHGLRGAAHDEIVRIFGGNTWVMCCHPDEFCYHDPRRVAALADEGGYDLVAWYCPHFYPHPSELPFLEELRGLPVPQRHKYFHWGFLDTDLPWIEDRLYRNSADVTWDGRTQGSVCPLGIKRPAPFHPILKHYKVCSLDLRAYQNANGHTLYRDHWVDQGESRTGLRFSVRRTEDLFVEQIPNYQHCDRFNGSFRFPWNMCEKLRYDSITCSESFEDELCLAQTHVSEGHFSAAEALLQDVRSKSQSARIKSIVCNNFGAIRALQSSDDQGRVAFAAALALDRSNSAAAENLSIVESVGCISGVRVEQAVRDTSQHRTKIAIVSLLFNWPSTGGGNIHTKELAEFLQRAGFDVLHVFARFEPWGIGRCQGPLSVPTTALEFDEAAWQLEGVVARFRCALDAYCPDHVIITDSWNSKPWLAEAARDCSYVLRFQALENLCPLNNVRLVPGPDGRARQCGRHQLATPAVCHACCHSNRQSSGSLHEAERRFSRVGTQEYDTVLRRAIESAAAVLVVNPLMQAMLSPWNERTIVVPAGMDPDRFASLGGACRLRAQDDRKRLIFAGLINEYMKGFHVLREACDRLWSKRRDFELVVTGDSAGEHPRYARFVGWLDQRELVTHLASSDMLAFPTIAQEALGRTAVEAMGVGIPVVASRIGGLCHTVVDGLTGLLADPGDPVDLAEKIETLLDDAELRTTLGANGRRRFERDYAWPVIIERHYRPLFASLSCPGPTASPSRVARG